MSIQLNQNRNKAFFNMENKEMMPEITFPKLEDFGITKDEIEYYRRWVIFQDVLKMFTALLIPSVFMPLFYLIVINQSRNTCYLAHF